MPAVADTGGEAPVSPPTVVEPEKGHPPSSTQPIRKPIVVRQLLSIEFGAFASGQGGGSVTVSPSGGRIHSGDITPLNSGISGAAAFEIIGQPEEALTIYLPERVTINKDNGNGDTVITNLTSAPTDTVTLDAQGRARVKVGGTLKVPGNVTPGSYSGAFDIDVRYLQ